MMAIIIPFPQRPLTVDSLLGELCRDIELDRRSRDAASTTDAWTVEDRRAYDTLAAEHGHTQALRTVEAMRNIKRVIPGEPDRALRMAQESFRLMVQGQH